MSQSGHEICMCGGYSVRQRWNWIPDAAAGKTGGAQATAAAAPKKQGPTIILFIVGGMTYSEMRAAYEVANATDYQIIIGKCVSVKVHRQSCLSCRLHFSLALQ